MYKLELKKIYNQNCCYETIVMNNKKYFKKTLIQGNIQFLLNEQKILSILGDYDNFPKIYSVDIQNKTIIYEYLEGYSLDIIGKIDIESAIKIMLKIIDILKIVHNNNIVHCDLKLSNIMINNDKIYLLDFGISQYKGINKCLGYGSIRYCSPEQYKNEIIDSRSDIYALGIILYELITNESFLKYSDKTQIIDKKLCGNLCKISDYINVPHEIDDIFMKATMVKKENRYMNLDLMEKDLKFVLLKYYNEEN